MIVVKLHIGGELGDNRAESTLQSTGSSVSTMSSRSTNLGGMPAVDFVDSEDLEDLGDLVDTSVDPSNPIQVMLAWGTEPSYVGPPAWLGWRFQFSG